MPADDVVVIPNGFSPTEFNPDRRAARRAEMRERLGLKADEVVLLFVANELERKGYRTLLSAIASLPKAPLRLLVVGRAPETQVQRLAAAAGVSDRVIACGPTRDVASFHAAADLFVLPTQYEAFCFAILEALGSGLPVVTTRVPGAHDAIRPGVNGALISDPQSVSQLTMVLELLLEADVRAALSANAPETVQCYHWPVVLDRYEQVLREKLSMSDSQGTGSPRKPTRLMSLDILRGIAILLVIGRHPVIPSDDAGVFRYPAGLWTRFGWTGVDLFFVLSGFLIGGLLLNELQTRGRLDARRFLLRRGFRIWPAYYIYLLYLLIDFRITQPQVPFFLHLRMMLPSLFHVQNYLWLPDKREHLWSLAVEEQFYLILVFLMLFLIARRRSGSDGIALIPVVAVGTMLTCLLLRCWVHWRQPFSFDANFYPTHLRVDGLIFGVLLAYGFHVHPERLAALGRHRTRLLIAGACLISPMLLLKLETVPFVSTLGYTCLYVGYGCLLLAFVYAQPGTGRLANVLSGRTARAVAFVGQSSYSIYLWHQDLGRFPLMQALSNGFLAGLTPSARWVATTCLYLLLSILGGVLLGALIERPFLALRDRLLPGRAAAVETRPEQPGPEGVAGPAIPNAEVLLSSPRHGDSACVTQADLREVH